MAATVILKAVTGEQAGREFVCAGRSQFVIGRSRSCSLHLPEDPTVSRHHCLLDVASKGVRVQDLGSKNGTFVNGALVGQRDDARGEDATQVEISPIPLRSGDELRVGHNVFVVEVHSTGDSSQFTAGERSLALA